MYHNGQNCTDAIVNFMNNDSIENQTIALAALHQAASLVQDIATTGSVDQAAFTTCLNSLLKVDKLTWHSSAKSSNFMLKQ